MNIVQRVQDILLKPKETWPVIEAEAADTSSIYKDYLMLLAAIPAVAGFIGLSLIGVGGWGFSYRVPFFSGLVHMVVSYALSLGAVYVLALIADALAPNFGGTKNPVNALKLIAYGCTAGYVGGIVQVIPMLGILGFVAVCYSIYLIHVGAPVLMKTAPEKTAGYTAVVLVCGLVAFFVFAAVARAVVPGMGMHGYGGWGGSHGGNISIKGPGGDIEIDTSKMEAAAKRMEAAGKQMEAAQKSGDSAAAGKAMSDMMGAMTGSAGVNAAPVAAADLKALLPDSLAGLKRESVEAVGNQAMGMNGTSAKAGYVDGDKRLNVSITDLGSMGGLTALAGWANTTVDRETATEIEKVFKQGGRTVREKWHKDGSRSEISVITEGGVIVEAQGDRLDMAALRAAVQTLDLGRVESLKKAAKS